MRTTTTTTIMMMMMMMMMIVQFSPLTDWAVGEHAGRFSGDPLPVVSAGGHCEQFWRGQGCPFYDVLHPAFLLPTTASSSTFQGALKDGFGEAVVARDMLEQRKFLSLDSC